MEERADKYQVVLLDHEGNELGARPAATLVVAKQEMAYLLSKAAAHPPTTARSA